MCNEVARRIALNVVREDFSQLRIPLHFPEGLPNLEPLASIRITDSTAIVRWRDDGAELVQRQWSWRGPSGKPVYNYRSDGRQFRNSDAGGRCLVPVDAFYEFTAPRELGQKRKDKWAFTKAGEDWFCLAGLWRAGMQVKGAAAKESAAGEAFTLLTTEPGPDVAPYHSRQMVVIERRDWRGWLDGSVVAGEVCGPLGAGVLAVAGV